MHRLPVLILLLSLLACGDDDNGTGPGFANVSGTWTFSITSMTAEDATCSTSSPLQVTFQQNTTTLSGSFNGAGVLTCTAPFGSFSTAISAGSVTNGQIDGNQISFDLGSAALHQEGTVTGSFMSGSATWNMQSGSASTLGTLTGSWSATRQ